MGYWTSDINSVLDVTDSAMHHLEQQTRMLRVTTPWSFILSVHRPPVCVKVNLKRFKLRGNSGHKSLHSAGQPPHWFGVHCHTTATSCYLRREKVAVDAAIEEPGVRA